MSTLSSRADIAFRHAVRSSAHQTERASSTNAENRSTILSGRNIMPPLAILPNSTQVGVRQPSPRHASLTTHPHYEDDSDEEYDIWLDQVDAEAARPTDASIAQVDKTVRAARNRLRSEFGSANVEDHEREAIETPLRKWAFKVTKPLLEFQQAQVTADSTECQMCFETYGVQIPEGISEVALQLPCKHIFGDKCMQRWLAGSKQMECPYCRARLVPSVQVHGPCIATTWLRNMAQYLREIQSVRRQLLDRREEADEGVSRRLVNESIRARRAREAVLNENRPSSRRRITLSGPYQASSAQQRPLTTPGNTSGAQSPRTLRQRQGHSIHEDHTATPETGLWTASAEEQYQLERSSTQARAPLGQASVNGQLPLPGAGYLGIPDALAAPRSIYTANANESQAVLPRGDLFFPSGVPYEGYVGRNAVLGTDTTESSGALADGLSSGARQGYYYATQLNYYTTLGMPQPSSSSDPRYSHGDDLMNPS
ncbi:uncharacterized protein J7T54_006020 [Emericellopsis cladophorae]|uniref:RING-type domain-containing protein n=1 Tax=Emericellopsis cladophorae TaxID=2686198 RepID=A0A9P9Y914_9HYPO|nr:uncharacterized protein J7T54_006020 [Emericellopsis cladophorae]KAI6785686.1 hypothetical protein J7T54_006020 [Emericellopsis cladophorae]